MQEYKFKDNIDIDNFFRLSFEQRNGFNINPADLDFVFKPLLSLLIDDIPRAKRKSQITIQETKPQPVKGFWVKKQQKGFQPVSRDNAGLIYNPLKRNLIMCGGFSSKQNFDVYELALHGSAKWTTHLLKHNIPNSYGSSI